MSEISETILKKSEGGMLIYELANTVRRETGLRFDDTDKVHECVGIYDSYLSKNRNKCINKSEKITKSKIKRLIRDSRKIKDIYKRRETLWTIVYMLKTLELTKT